MPPIIKVICEFCEIRSLKSFFENSSEDIFSPSLSNVIMNSLFLRFLRIISSSFNRAIFSGSSEKVGKNSIFIFIKGRSLFRYSLTPAFMNSFLIFPITIILMFNFIHLNLQALPLILLLQYILFHLLCM